MHHNDVRRTFLDYFQKQGHRLVRSANLIPHGDPTLMFTNAGMNQFKNLFLGLETRDYTRATSSQKCLRVAGKHNDFEEVGRTARHHTFFEMLGNFSFGDYFKREAIRFAWELFTEVYKLDPARLYVTVYEEDDDAEKLWQDEVGFPLERIHRLGKKEYYWSMGPTGPNGPCSEIHYDMAPVGRPRTREELIHGAEGFVELWNLVFMQFNTREDGVTEPLPKPSVDTGAGLERVTAALQGVLSNYDTSLFMPYIEAVSDLAGVNYGDAATPEKSVSVRVIADHLRAMSFLIADGALPSNEGRGYVLRRIIRRAIRHGRLIGLLQPFLHKQTELVARTMADAYPELLENRDYLGKVVLSEEERFGRSFDLSWGKLMEIVTRKKHIINSKYDSIINTFNINKSQIDKYIDITRNYAENKVESRKEFVWTNNDYLTIKSNYKLDSVDDKLLENIFDIFREKIIDSNTVFELYDTYGLPLDMALEIASEKDLIIFTKSFEAKLNEQRARARASWKGSGETKAEPVFQAILEEHGATDFIGYEQEQAPARVLAIVRDGKRVEQLREGEEGKIVLDRTPFYAESGGQVGDTGRLHADGFAAAVRDTVKVEGKLHVHLATVTAGELKVGMTVTAEIDFERRASIRRNHTVTHIMQWALRDLLGGHVKQAGSLVAPDRVRFDFTHFSAMDPDEVKQFERAVNRQILKADVVRWETKGLDEALNEGVTALFGEKYGDVVRIVRTGDYSAELCGGTHVRNTGEIGLFHVLSETSVAAGVRRIEAVTGVVAAIRARAEAELIAETAGLLRAPHDSVTDSVRKLLDEHKSLQKEIQQLRIKLASAGASGGGQAYEVTEVGPYKIATQRTSGMDAGTLKNLADEIRSKIKSGAVIIGDDTDGKPTLILASTDDIKDRVNCGQMIKDVGRFIQGGGGGSPTMAQAGGKDASHLDEALAKGRDLIAAKLQKEN